LAASGFVDPASGISGIANFDGTLSSDGTEVRSRGRLKAEQLKLVPRAAPAGRPVEVRYSIEHDMKSQSGKITQGNVSLGKAAAQLTGAYSRQGASTLLNLRLNGQAMPVDDLEAMLPALGVNLPSGSSLNGGTLSAILNIGGTADKPVITGPLRLTQTKLSGFDLGSKLSSLSKFTGSQGGPDTSIQNLSTALRFAADGIQTQNVNLTVPALGVLTGSGTISPSGALNYKMTANLSGNLVSGLTQLAGLGNKGTSISFFVRGTTSNPSFVPDVQGTLSSQLKSRLPGSALQDQNPQKNSVINKITGLFHRKKN